MRRTAPFLVNAFAISYAERLALALLLSLALLLPSASAALAHWLPGAQTVIICTGSGMMEVTLDGENQPAKAIEHRDKPCVGVCGLLIAGAGAPFWLIAAQETEPAFALRVHPGADQARLAGILPKRGPPGVA